MYERASIQYRHIIYDNYYIKILLYNISSIYKGKKNKTIYMWWLTGKNGKFYIAQRLINGCICIYYDLYMIFIYE